jgi:hypothetical protein
MESLTFKNPSGNLVTIREQNGDDDGVLSKMKNSKDGTAITKFVSGIVIAMMDGPGPTANEVMNWKNKDKYYTTFRSRIFSLGDLITFKLRCKNDACKKENEYEESLLPYIDEFDGKKENSFKYKIQPYRYGDEKDREIILSSGKKIKYTYLNGHSEKKLLEIKEDDMDRNTEFLVRNIQWHFEDRWQPLQTFGVLSAKDMKEIRADITENDLPFDAISECECPFCGHIQNISLMAQTGFFFPQEA